MAAPAEPHLARPLAAPCADAAPLGFAALAATTFVHSAYHARLGPELAFFGSALFLGGLAQLLAGMLQFQRGETFTATLFSVYGSFWMGSAAFAVLVVTGRVPGPEVQPSFGWLFAALTIFTAYMALASGLATIVRLAVVLFALMDLLLSVAFLFRLDMVIVAGGYAGIAASLVAWYVSAARIVVGRRRRLEQAEDRA